MRYADANLFIYAAMDRGQLGQGARQHLEHLALTRQRIAASVLVLDEVTWQLKKRAGSQYALTYCRGLLADPALYWIDVTPEILKKAFDVIDAYGINPRDAIHAASCFSVGAHEIISQDIDFDKVPGLKRIPVFK